MEEIQRSNNYYNDVVLSLEFCNVTPPPPYENILIILQKKRENLQQKFFKCYDITIKILKYK